MAKKNNRHKEMICAAIVDRVEGFDFIYDTRQKFFAECQSAAAIPMGERPCDATLLNWVDELVETNQIQPRNGLQQKRRVAKEVGGPKAVVTSFKFAADNVSAMNKGVVEARAAVIKAEAALAAAEVKWEAVAKEVRPVVETMGINFEAYVAKLMQK